MEPVTHLLTGACLARSGFNRSTAYATAAMTLAAEMPDIDTLWSFGGPVEGLQHHRGITHTFVGIPFEAAFLLLGFILWEAWRKRRRSGQAPPGRPTALPGRRTKVRAPVRWGVLFGLIVLALLSHILLDYTNNYGVRPFFPFDKRWHAASLVFIFDPLLFALLVAGLLFPSLFALIGREVGGKREAFPGRGWARAALAAVVLLWGLRAVEHSRALTLASQLSLRTVLPATSPNPAESDDPNRPAPETHPVWLPARAALANPDPLNPFRWYTVTEFGSAYQLGLADTHRDSWFPGEVLPKPAPSEALRVAKESHLGRVYLDWSPMPLISVGAPGAQPVPFDGEEGTLVTFSDPRFMGDVPLLSRQGKTPLTGAVLLDRTLSVKAESMDGRVQR